MGSVQVQAKHADDGQSTVKNAHEREWKTTQYHRIACETMNNWISEQK